ncbi:MAG: hypothetical protein A2Z91_00125 [Deltaproteobacteria bacterium GWA2_38_16]|nr:MAG: hypothetical protein A2Z91_00125 [Deltaproteobacteria bacterium GWA2_38_16]OGQ03512.1 MAG: hypothetical protein A3D19_01530 [Deltaproteobacteria bacterium RIFCSPHIGHO2_02_FULL_38_15]OGQ30391.1 MAG: hypothetical protein A3A72_01755 [Deltaproteobacteria bacterium RIFCSPLOWO2_01_FULL_38_9]OGQ60093.1 MAG: hypothetical protein A3G92_02715 [Deltaproteobacteria bacterium RIFCSPLOWO2_12_FULL_38_8]
MKLNVLFGAIFSVLLINVVIVNHGFSASSGNLYFKNSIIETEKISALAQDWASHETLEATIRPAKSSSYYIVQFEGISGSAFRKQLQKISDVKRYVPDNGFIIKLKGTALDLERLNHLQWYSHYGSYLKVEKTLLNLSKDSQVTLNIHLFSDEDSERVQKEVLALPIQVLETSRTLMKAQAPGSVLSKIAAVEGVEWIQKAKEPKLGIIKVENVGQVEVQRRNDFDQFDGYATGSKVLNADALYSAGIRGQSEKIAITDTGLDRGRLDSLPRDLAGRVDKTYSLGRPSVGQWDDPVGHGTHVAGLALGNGALSQGAVRGVAYEARLIFQSVFRWISQRGKVEKGMVLPTAVDKLFEISYNDGARVHSNSWQYDTGAGQYDVQSSLVDEFVWNHPDFVPVFAAGNSGMDLDGDGLIDPASIAVPSTAKNCISVGASENFMLRGGIQAPWSILGTTGSDSPASIWGGEPIASDLPSDSLNGIAAFSSRGPTEDGRIKPDIVAPGTNNLSLKSKADEVDENESWGTFNDNYIFMGGTSMSTPLVAGAVALVRQYYEQVEKRNFISSALVKATLINGAQDLFPGQFQNFKEIETTRPNMQEGFGRVDLGASLLPSLPRVRRSIDDTQGVGEGEERTYSLKVTHPQEALRVTLVYSDYPSSPSVVRALVNDLDVTIQDASGKVFFPNGLSEADRLNNVENIDLDTVRAGTYTVRVRGVSVPVGQENSGKQPFALVISGGIEL